MHWTSLYSPLGHETCLDSPPPPSSWTIDLIGQEPTPASPVIVTSGGHHWKLVQTCSLSGPTSPQGWHLVAIESYWNAFLFHCVLRGFFLPSATKLRRLCFYMCLSVILFTRGAIPACIAGGIPACLVGGASAPGGVCLLQGGACSRGCACSRGGVWRAPPPKADGYCCGGYPFYWNAFLFPDLLIVSPV